MRDARMSMHEVAADADAIAADGSAAAEVAADEMQPEDSICWAAMQRQFRVSKGTLLALRQASSATGTL